MKMKKITIVATLLFLVALVSSCKSHETCPAYGKVQTDKSLPS